MNYGGDAIAVLDRKRRRRWGQRPPARSLMEFSYTLKIPDTEDELTRQPLPNDPATHAPSMYALQLAQGDIVRPCDGMPYSEFAFCSDTQDAKSWIIQQIMFHCVIERSASVGYLLPTRDLYEKIFDTKLTKVCDEAGLKRYWPVRGGGSRGGVTFKAIRMRVVGGRGGGTLVPMSSGGRNQSGQAAVTLRELVFDELDDWLALSYQKARRRVDRFASEGNAKIYKASTVKDNKERSYSLILQEIQRGCRARILYCCPHCNGHAPFEWETFKYEKEEYEDEVGEMQRRVVPGSARLSCALCDHEITDAERTAMLQDGHKLQIQDGRALNCSLRWDALECPWKSLEWLAEQDRVSLEDEERGIIESRRTFVQDQMAMEYHNEGAGQNPTTMGLAHRSARSDYDRGEIPDDATSLVVAIDIQRDRCYWLAMAGTNDGRRYIIEWKEQYWSHKGQEPTDALRNAVLDEVLNGAREGWARADGEVVHANFVMVDIKYETKAIGRWVKQHADVRAVRGDEHEGKRRKAPDNTTAVREYVHGRVRLRKMNKKGSDQTRFHWVIATIQGREAMRAGFARDLGDMGSWHLPRGVAADDPMLRHLTAWRLEVSDDGIQTWVRYGRRDDYADDCGYADAMIHYHYQHEEHKAVTSGRTYGVIKTGGL